MAYICAIIVGYLLGCVNPAYFLGKLHGFDIRTKGSYSAGASNAKITMGWPYFFIVLAYDLCKAALAVFIIGKLFGQIAVQGKKPLFAHSAVANRKSEHTAY